MPLPAVLAAILPTLASGAVGAGVNALSHYLGGGSTSGQPGNPITGYSGQEQRFSNFTEPQLGAQNQALQQVMSYLQSGGRPSQPSVFGNFDFAPIANQARRNFQENTIPSLAERFTAQGSGTRSGPFRGALARAATNLDTNLASLEQNYRLAQGGQNMQLLQLLLQSGLAPQFQSAYAPAQPGFLHAVAPDIGQAFGTWLAQRLAGAPATPQSPATS